MGHPAATLTCIAPLYSALEWKHEAFFNESGVMSAWVGRGMG